VAKHSVSLIEGAAFVPVRDTVVLLIKTELTIGGWRVLESQLSRLAAEEPAGACLLSLNLPGATVPNATTRVAAQTFLRQMGPRLRRIVAVADGDSVWLSVLRTVIRAIGVLSGRGKQTFVVANLDEALDRLAEVAGPGSPSRGEFLEAIDALYATFGAARVSARPMAVGDRPRSV
jgi:hypothetical protein